MGSDKLGAAGSGHILLGRSALGPIERTLFLCLSKGHQPKVARLAEIRNV